ncbi:MAG: phosphoribosyl-AMP cyclohydrolase [Hyphomicrobiaceae bacterium]
MSSDQGRAPVVTIVFSERGSTQDIERGAAFTPKFDNDGLIPAIVTDADTGGVLMFAYMTAETLALTLQTSTAHFWSRSRKRIWKKGEESGNALAVVEALTDCDQDVVWLRVRVQGSGVACHTGAPSCFYRVITVVADAEGGHAAQLHRSDAPAAACDDTAHASGGRD